MADDRPADASRRQFFRVFSRQTVVGAGTLLGTVNELRETSATAAGQLLGLSEISDEPVALTPEAAFRSPYRFTGDALLIVDQRGLPAQARVIECRTADLAASAVRAGAAGSGPVLGQIAAFALVLSVSANRDQPTTVRRSAFRLASSTLRAARFHQYAVRSAIARMEAVDACLADELPAADHTGALRAEAEQIATEASLDHARLGQLGAELVAAAVEARDRPSKSCTLLIHGDGSTMSGGLVGTSFTVVAALAAAGRPAHVWLTEGAPTMEGARIGAWQLTANDVPHTIVADTAVDWLLAARRIDAVILRADWACSNTDIAAPVGSLGAARAAAAENVPVFAFAPASVIDRACDSGDAIPTELRQPLEDRPGPRIDPAADVVRADLITKLIGG